MLHNIQTVLERIRSQPVWRPTRPWKDWQAERDQQLHRFINEQLYPFSPFYRRLFDDHHINPRTIRRLSDLRHLPFTSKKDIAPTADNPTRPLDLVLRPDEESIRRYAPKAMAAKFMLERLRCGGKAVKDRLRLEYFPVHVTYTTGRSAMPTQFLYASKDFERLHIVGKRMIELCGAQMGDRALNVFPFAPHLAFWQTFAVAQATTMLIVHTGGGKVAGTAGNIAALSRLQPSMLIGVPGYVYHLLRQAREQRVELSSLKQIALGAERVPPALKARLAELCEQMGAPGVVVHGVYGFTEARHAWAECTPPDHATSYGYHTYPDFDVFEIVNPDSGEPVGPGERGEIVYTSLSGRGSCVLRYRTGDVAEGGMVYDPCPGCGRIVPRISQAISRRSDVGEFQLTKIRGTLVDLNGFIPIMAAMGDVVEWQLIVKKVNDDPEELDELVLSVALAAGVEAESLKRRLCEHLLNALEVAPNR
ncbi:MAG: AMP-binding protein, partial [Candidatus Eremiobacteraeota bacterium]|nr:AMP-binding protein [Candidatus Eremiobacteraeota bacterium]